MRQFVAVLADYFAQKHHFAQIVYDNAAFRAILSKYFLAEPLEAQHLDHAQTVQFFRRGKRILDRKSRLLGSQIINICFEHLRVD